MAALVQRIRARAASLPTFDIPFLLILLLLLSYGLIMLFSAGYAVALYRHFQNLRIALQASCLTLQSLNIFLQQDCVR